VIERLEEFRPRLHGGMVSPDLGHACPEKERRRVTGRFDPPRFLGDGDGVSLGDYVTSVT
jgi:hypothetical protein